MYFSFAKCLSIKIFVILTLECKTWIKSGTILTIISQISTCLKATLWWLHWSVLTWIFWTSIETSWENNFFFDNNFLWAFHKNSIAMQEDKKNIPIKLPYKFNCLQYYMYIKFSFFFVYWSLKFTLWIKLILLWS